MNFVKRTDWSEAEIDALPSGEHDLFERKSGKLFSDRAKLLGELAKALSAFANSGGGHLILGVDDNGVPDGVPPREGRTSTREWLEQKIPFLVQYPLADFRVHEVQPLPGSRIPQGKVVIVIDIGDSALAPHQCFHDGGGVRKHIYYYRQAGRSEPAPHFYIELLRQRLTSPSLDVALQALQPVQAHRSEGAIFLALRLRFTVSNVGRLAAYKWQIQMRGIRGHIDDRVDDYRWRVEHFPPGYAISSGVRIDDTILAGGALYEDHGFGVMLRPSEYTTASIRTEIETMLSALIISYRVVTEVSIGADQDVELIRWYDSNELAQFVSGQLGL